MSDRKTITASLEGMRIIVDGKQCELQEYDFKANRWLSKDQADWPLARSVADQWLAGWNGVDRFAAVNVLTRPQDEPGNSQRFTRRFGEPHF